MLPSLDRLAGLIERVVELVDEVGGSPERESEPVAVVPEPVPARGWLAFVPSAEGYALIERPGSPPEPGDCVDLDGSSYRVLRHAPSPFPGDRRRCIVLEREEPSAADRSFDA